MLVTNGKRIVLLPRDEAELEKVAATLKKRAKDVLGVKNAKFAIVEDPFPHIVNENEFTFAELKQLCVPDIDLQFRAIGNERVQLPDTKMKDIKHVYSPDEKMQIADDFCNAQYEKETVEAEAKAEAKKFKQQIDKFETQISDLSTKHRQGYEMQNVECHLHLDFENEVRVYTDKETGDILSTEPLLPTDRQMRIEFKEGQFEQPEAPEAPEVEFEE